VAQPIWKLIQRSYRSQKNREMQKYFHKNGLNNFLKNRFIKYFHKNEFLKTDSLNIFIKMNLKKTDSSFFSPTTSLYVQTGPIFHYFFLREKSVFCGIYKWKFPHKVRIKNIVRNRPYWKEAPVVWFIPGWPDWANLGH
jgi:hypothetical protein